MQTSPFQPRIRTTSLRTVLVLTAAAAALGACASLPGRSPPAPAVSVANLASDQSLAAPVADWVADRWWDSYGDAQLSGLIDEALAHSPTQAQAEARMRAADAQAGRLAVAGEAAIEYGGGQCGTGMCDGWGGARCARPDWHRPPARRPPACRPVRHSLTPQPLPSATV